MSSNNVLAFNPQPESVKDHKEQPGDFPDLWNYFFQHRPAIDKSIEHELPTAIPGIETQFDEAVHRAIFPGGKRIRPMITLLGAELFGGSVEKALSAAVAVEFVHTSSLIFDDLPGMDDASHRRGEMSLHKRYSEGLATLVAISYLNTSYRLVAASEHLDRDQVVAAITEIVDCVGPAGMVAGQSLDLHIRGANHVPTAEKQRLQNLKTSALIRLSLILGAIFAGADAESIQSLKRFALILGDAYQKSDDLLDLNEDEKYVKNGFGFVKEARAKFLKDDLARDVHAAKHLLQNFLPESHARNCLEQLTDFVACRGI
jgi:geranylgeranyl pyrophosphate synthase